MSAVTPAHVRLMDKFVNAPEIQAIRGDAVKCQKAWEMTLKTVRLPPCPMEDALAAWTQAEDQKAGEMQVSRPDRDGMVSLTLRTHSGTTSTAVPARTLFLQALHAYALSFRDPGSFLSDVQAMAKSEARRLSPPPGPKS